LLARAPTLRNHRLLKNVKLLLISIALLHGPGARGFSLFKFRAQCPDHVLTVKKRRKETLAREICHQLDEKALLKNILIRLV